MFLQPVAAPSWPAAQQVPWPAGSGVPLATSNKARVHVAALQLMGAVALLHSPGGAAPVNLLVPLALTAQAPGPGPAGPALVAAVVAVLPLRSRVQAAV